MITEPVGAVLARDAGAAVRQTHPVIVQSRARWSATPVAPTDVTVPVGAVLARDAGTTIRQGHRVITQSRAISLLQIWGVPEKTQYL